MSQKIIANSQQKMTQDKPNRSQFYIFIASTISCTINMTVCNPLEVAKLKHQYSPVACPEYPHLTFKQLNNCECTRFRYTDAFKGLSISLFHGLISNTLYMQFYEYQRQAFIKYLPSGLATLSSALSSRLMVSTLMIPIEAFRVRFTNSTQNSQINASKTGLKATLARDLIYSCLYWFTIQQMRNVLMGEEYREHKHKSSMLYTNIIPAMIGGSLISFITTPLDTVKTRLQSGIEMSGSLWSQFKQIYKKQGHLGLFAGVQHRVMRNTLSSVLYLTLFQYIIDKLQSGRYFLKNTKDMF